MQLICYFNHHQPISNATGHFFKGRIYMRYFLFKRLITFYFNPKTGCLKSGTGLRDDHLSSGQPDFTTQWH